MSKTILNSSGYCDPSCFSPNFAKSAFSFPIKHEMCVCECVYKMYIYYVIYV